MSHHHHANELSIPPGAVADKAGIRPNDIVYEFAGRSIASATDLRNAVDMMSTGDLATVKLRRNSAKEIEVTARF